VKRKAVPDGSIFGARTNSRNQQARSLVLDCTWPFVPAFVHALDRPAHAWYAPPVSLSRDTRLDALAHADALHRLALRLCGSAPRAEDLVQETYARAFAADARFVEGTNLRAWLCRILRNAYVDGLRRSRLEESPSADVDDVAPATSDDALRGDGELERLRTVVSRDIQAALMSLSADARTVVLLDLEGFTETELAEILGCAIGTVKSRLARARAALRERLGDYAR